MKSWESGLGSGELAMQVPTPFVFDFFDSRFPVPDFWLLQ